MLMALLVHSDAPSTGPVGDFRWFLTPPAKPATTRDISEAEGAVPLLEYP